MMFFTRILQATVKPGLMLGAEEAASPQVVRKAALVAKYSNGTVLHTKTLERSSRQACLVFGEQFHY